MYKQVFFYLQPVNLSESILEFVRLIEDDPEVGAVIVDFDVNMNRLKMQKVLTYLKREDCLFIAAACDRELPLGIDIGPIIGTKNINFSFCVDNQFKRTLLLL